MTILHEYRYAASGLDEIVLIDGVEEEDTPYGPAIRILDLDGLHATLGRAICERPRTMIGKEIRFLRDEMDLSQKGLAALLGTTEQAVFRWETGRSTIPGPAQRLLAIVYLETLGDRMAKPFLAHLAQFDSERAERPVVARWADGWRLAA